MNQSSIIHSLIIQFSTTCNKFLTVFYHQPQLSSFADLIKFIFVNVSIMVLHDTSIVSFHQPCSLLLSLINNTKTPHHSLFIHITWPIPNIDATWLLGDCCIASSLSMPYSCLANIIASFGFLPSLRNCLYFLDTK